MQQTKKYKFNLIETSDPFSPEALNANAQAVEDKLAALEAADAALAGADAAVKAELQAADAALQTAIGSGGKNARIAYGSYSGKGSWGSGAARTLTFDFQPYLVFIVPRTWTGGVYFQILARPALRPLTNVPSPNCANCGVTWGDKQVSWYGSGGDAQLDASGVTYYWVAIGESVE